MYAQAAYINFQGLSGEQAEELRAFCADRQDCGRGVAVLVTAGSIGDEGVVIEEIDIEDTFELHQPHAAADVLTEHRVIVAGSPDYFATLFQSYAAALGAAHYVINGLAVFVIEDEE